MSDRRVNAPASLGLQAAGSGSSAASFLDARLEAAAELIRAERHTDIGSDHASLPIWLLQSGRAGRVIVVEKTPGPLEVARRALTQAGVSGRAELRLGDGLEPLHPAASQGELESVSLTGMGARTMLGILERGRAAGRVPAALVVQPNDGAGLLRGWARAHGYRLVAERMASGFWRYPVLRLERQKSPVESGTVGNRTSTATDHDPAYDGLPEAAALWYGPHLLRQAHPLLVQELRAQLARLEPLERHARPRLLTDLSTVRSALAWLEQQT
ncbi:tRNA (adenine(22)-N(1))-methyltransferase [Deinococcus altitudinis]|uniref:tRNA (adenine(22)-N(1))-methyltransferase n=1 Tax=Deinococcus altitudinis TaxID=468914 RepID=UPI003892CC45